MMKVLLIEDDEFDAHHTRRMLQQGFGKELELDRVSDAISGRQAIERGEHTVCLVDYQLGPDDGVELVRDMVANGCVMPMIILTGMVSTTVDMAAMEAGATDYVVKDDLSSILLCKTIRYAVARQQFQSSLIEATELLHRKNQKLAKLYQTAHQFVDNVSHEFRTPLTVIKEYSAILQEGLLGPLNNEQAKYLGIILNRVDDLGLMVNDMLDSSRLEAGLLNTRRRTHDLVKIVDRIKPVLMRKAAGNAVDFVIEIEPDVPEVYCDAEKVGRVIINLSVNAIKFSDENGKVSLGARYDESTSQVVIDIKDTGRGIAEDQLQKIFERFQQAPGDVRASTHGFGLGLNIAKELVHLNLGEISLESEPGKGSTFSFTVPTFMPAAIFGNWLSRIERLMNGIADISLFAVHCPPSADPQLTNEAADLIQGTVFHEDLLLSTGPGAWILAAATPKQELDNLIERIQLVREDMKRSRPDQELPDFTLDLLGSWGLATDRRMLIDAFSSLLNLENGLAIEPARLVAKASK